MTPVEECKTKSAEPEPERKYRKLSAVSWSVALTVYTGAPASFSSTALRYGAFLNTGASFLLFTVIVKEVVTVVLPSCTDTVRAYEVTSS